MGRKFLDGIDPISGVALTVGGVPPNAAGDVPVPPGYAGWDGTAVLAADVTSSTTSGATSSLAVPSGLTAGTYELHGVMMCTSAATTTGVQLAITAATGATPAVMWANPSSGTALAFAFDRTGGTWHATTAAPYTAGNPWPVFLDGTIVVASTTTTAMSIMVRTEIAASAVVLKAGSFLSWRKLGAQVVGAVSGLPPGAVVATSGTTRPTARTDIVVMFTGADPGGNALTGDVWLGA